MKTKLTILALVAATSLVFADERTDTNRVANKHSLTLEGAKAIAEAAAKFARENGAGPSIAVVDEGGHLLYFVRPEGGFVAGANVSIGKARTSAIFKKPTAFFEDTINKGRFTMTALSDFTPLQGGVQLGTPKLPASNSRKNYCDETDPNLIYAKTRFVCDWRDHSQRYRAWPIIGL